MWFFKTQFLHEKKFSFYFHFFFFMCTLSFMCKEAKKMHVKSVDVWNVTDTLTVCDLNSGYLTCIFYTFPCEHETCAYFVYNGMVHFCLLIFVYCFFYKNIEYLHMKNIFVTQHL